MDGPNHDRVFHFEGLGVRVSAGDPAHLDWLEDFFAPHISASGDGLCRFHVRFTADEVLYEKMIDRGPAGGEADVFALDSSVVRLPFWNDPDGATTLHDERFFAFYQVREDPPLITITARDEHLRGRTPMMRVVRELAMNHGRRIGGFFVHGSSFAVGGEGVILAGPKHSGKTTLLIHALENGGAEYVANDRVMVRVDDEGVRYRGVPSIVTIREPTTALFPGLLDRLLSSGYHFRKNRKEMEGERGKTMKPWENGKYGLNPYQFRELLGAPAAAGARGRALVFPRLSDRTGGIEIERISPKEGAVRLRGALFGIDGLRKRSEVFVPHEEGADDGLEPIEDLCRRYTEAVSCYSCRLGAGAYEGDGSAERFIDRVLGGGGKP